ncbi:hypothetical protein Ancab_021328 [Ancistrocladus abbreviatus]
MALNFSHRPIFPAQLPEDNLVSPIRIANGCLMEGITERTDYGFRRTWHSSTDVEGCSEYGGNTIDMDSPVSVSTEIIDLLPGDPFGMNITSTVTAITGWLEDLEVDYDRYARVDIGTSNGDRSLLAELNLMWNRAMSFQDFPASSKVDDVVIGGKIEGCFKEDQYRGSFRHGGFQPFCPLKDIHSGKGTARTDQNQNSQLVAGVRDEVGTDGSHLALSFALGYLGVRDLLCVEMVCKSLRCSVQNEPLLWKSLRIDPPLSDRITDDVLLQLTDRAQGNLQCLSLVSCRGITDDGLKLVLEKNRRLTKLCLSGCNRLSINTVLSYLKGLNSGATTGVRLLRIGGILGLTHTHFEELKSLLGIGDCIPANSQKPLFYQNGNRYISCDDDRPIDVEVCPRCQNVTLVYDCPAESCQGKNHETQACRACTICIDRCVQCGRCINDVEYEETFCLEKLCSSCCNQPLNCQEREDLKVSPTKYGTDQESSYSFHG